MSSIEWMGLLALVTLISLLLGYLMFKVRAKYIHIEVHSDEPYSYEVERYGCVSLLATVFGVLFYTVTVTSLVVLLYQIVVIGIIPLLSVLTSTVTVIFGITLVLLSVLFIIMLVISFFKDLFNPPR
jgi:hypothetical protein